MKTILNRIIDNFYTFKSYAIAMINYFLQYFGGLMGWKNPIHPELCESTSLKRIWQISYLCASQSVLPELKENNEIIYLNALLVQQLALSYIKGLRTRAKIKSLFALPQ